MLTKKNMLQAAEQNLRDHKIVYVGGAAAYHCAIQAHRYAAMALGAAQNPFDAETVAKADVLCRLAADALQDTVAAQLKGAEKGWPAE